MHFDQPLAVHFDPGMVNATAREDQGVHAVLIDDRKLQIAVERRGCDRLPHGHDVYPCFAVPH